MVSTAINTNSSARQSRGKTKKSKTTSKTTTESQDDTSGSDNNNTAVADNNNLIVNKSDIKRSLSENTRTRRRKPPLNRTLSDPSHDKQSLVDELLAIPMAAVQQAEEFVKKVISAGWRVVSHRALPDWLQDNEYLLRGHRLPLNSFLACFKSIFRIHTETGNIWTHLLGMLTFMSIAVYVLTTQYVDFMWQDIAVHSVFFVCAITCLGFSWVYHTVFCHSEGVYKLFSKLDYCGIAILVVGSFVPWLYYSFYCSLRTHLFYLVSIISLGFSCIVVSLWDKFAQPEYRGVRAGLFIALGLTGVIPAIHFVTGDGLYHAFYDCGLGWLLLMAALYITGALLYACRIPEKYYPGMFDIWFQSHQIFHIFVVAAALVHYRGIQIIAHYRLADPHCPVD